MQDDDDICLCFRVSKRKIVNFCKREKPVRVSLISQCLSAGTGCGWCVPFIQKLYQQAQDGQADPDLPISPGEYASRRANYRQTGQRPGEDAQAKDGKIRVNDTHCVFFVRVGEFINRCIINTHNRMIVGE